MTAVDVHAHFGSQEGFLQTAIEKEMYQRVIVNPLMPGSYVQAEVHSSMRKRRFS